MHILYIFLLTINILTANKPKTCYSLWKAPKYNSKPFSYVNTQAPQGGTIRIGVNSTFNSLFPFTPLGTPPAGVGVFGPSLIYEKLLKRSIDEPFAVYPWIAQSFAVAKDHSQITFYLNPKAKWPDGQNITSEDVKFSYYSLLNHGLYFYKAIYKKVKEVICSSKSSITFKFHPINTKGKVKNYDQELPLILGQLTIFPSHLIKDFTKLSKTIPIGSGPYELKEFKFSKYLIFKKKKNYWANNLHCNQGQYNFNTIRFDYFPTVKEVLFEAFKKGEIDFFIDTDISNWIKKYNFPAYKNKTVIKRELERNKPYGMKGFVLNLRRPIFQNHLVRKAFLMLCPLHWINRNLYYSKYSYINSFYENSDFAHTKKLSPQAQNILNILKPQLLKTKSWEEILDTPQRYFAKNPREKRDNQLKAKKLLEKAGWFYNSKTHCLQHKKTGAFFEVTFLCGPAAITKEVIIFQQELKKVGIKLIIKQTPDDSQYLKYWNEFDFDMVIDYWYVTRSPGIEQNNRWHGDYSQIEGSRNTPGVNNPVVNIICEHITKIKSYDDLIGTLQLLDRALLNLHIVIPTLYNKKTFLAYYKDVNLPKTTYNDTITSSVLTWWKTKT